MMIDLLEDPAETLRDLVEVWPEGRARLGTSELLVRLTRLRPAAYSPWSVESLARRLRALGVPSVMIRTNEGPEGPQIRRGVIYRDLWDRYLVQWGPRHPEPRGLTRVLDDGPDFVAWAGPRLARWQGSIGRAAWTAVVVHAAREVASRARRGRWHRR